MRKSTCQTPVNCRGMGLGPKQMEPNRADAQASQPPSIAETVATIDEMAELGFLPKAIRAEFFTAESRQREDATRGGSIAIQRRSLGLLPEKSARAE